MFRFLYLFLSNNIILRNKNIINRHYSFNFKKNINNKRNFTSDYHNFIQNAKINSTGNIIREINENIMSIESKNESLKNEIIEEQTNSTNESNSLQEKNDDVILRWKYSNKLGYNGYDMRYPINNSQIDYENMYKIYELYNKKKLYDILLSNISIYTKLDYISKEEKHIINQNITNGGLYKDWDFDF